jgi:two-component system chemotaxis sensor kinase CheA
MDMSRYLDLFISEARQHIKEAEAEIAKFSPATTPEAESLNNLFRHFHSIKGMTASMGFAEISTLSHAVEDLFEEIREDARLGARPGIADLVLEALDSLSSMVQAASAGEQSFSTVDGLVARIKEAVGEFSSNPPGDSSPPPDPPQQAPSTIDSSAPDRIGEDRAPESAQPGADSTESPTGQQALSQGTVTVYRCKLQLDPEAQLPGARAALVLRRMESMGEVLTSTPSPEELRTGSFQGTLTVLISTRQPRSKLAADIEELLDVSSYSITEELLPTELPAREDPRQRESESGLPSTIRIPTASLDHFLDTLGELITWRGSLGAAVKAGDLAAVSESHMRLSRAVDQLREEVMAIRLLPFEHIVPQLNQGVRSLTRQTGKKVALQISGTDVSLDRAVLEEILDPLNHLLRNAVDHGVELPEDRIARGKDRTGRILLAVSRAGDRVHIRLEDDGRGMDTRQILDESLKRGFITAAEAEELSPHDILMLTTIPGFSTAKRATEISGRGVGMDVVRTRIEKLDGRIKLESRHGHGLTVVLDLPLTVAVIDAFIIESAGSIFAVPSSVAMRAQLVSGKDFKETRGGLFLDEGGCLIPAYRPEELLELTDKPRPLPFRLPVLLFSNGNSRAALAVDAIHERRELVVKPLGTPLEHLREYSGAALLDDGTIALILDLPNLAQASSASAFTS